MQSGLGPDSVPLFPQVTWESLDPRSIERLPYPGFRPSGSWRLTTEGRVHGLSPDGDRWQDRSTGDLVTIADRHLVLAYGSNLDPLKLQDKLLSHAGGELYAISAAVYGWGAVWCAVRRSDGSCTATLVPYPDSVEVHAVLAVTRKQLERMDDWEGHPRWYRRIRHSGTVKLENGTGPAVEVYLGTPERRPALVQDGRLFRLRECPYDQIDVLIDGGVW